MSINLHRDPKTIVPDFIAWFEEPFLTLRPYLGQAIKVEDYTEDGHYVLRAEVAGIDPEKELEVWVGSGYLTIRAGRAGKLEDKHRTEFRYGSFSRTVQLPPDADTDDVTTEYSHGILTIKLGLQGQQQGAMRRVQVAGSGSS
ncbi:MAG TPA: Hsp20/alpha crystallin family protein [Streptosporangiaceae bacterium]|nr:Hsp20/alpha crystallin family protein [Streptosporangiaceae bacterium]